MIDELGTCAVYDCTAEIAEPVVGHGTVLAYVCAAHYSVIMAKDTGPWMLRSEIGHATVIYPYGVDAPWPSDVA